MPFSFSGLRLGRRQPVGQKKEKASRRRCLFDWLSVFLRQEDGGGRAVGFGDDPDFSAVRKVVGRQNPKSFPDRKLVLAPVFLVEFAPIARDVAADEFQR